jgi:Ca2+/Na+ antiporter
MWVKCKVCGEDTYVDPAQRDDSSAYICPSCREAAKRRAKSRRDRIFMIVTAVVLIVPMIYLISQGQIQNLQFCWGGLILLAVAFFFTWRGRQASG